MAKKRVNELARTYDMPAKEVMAKLRAAGIEVKAASSAIDENDAKAALTGQPVKKAPDKAKENGKKAAAEAQPVRRTTLARQEAEKAQRAKEQKQNGGQGQRGPGKPATGPGAKRPTRSSVAGERAPGAPGGRRRVVIDSQASRRGPGGPGGPGGGPQQGPPRRQRRGRRRRGTYDETIQPLNTAAQSALDNLKVQSGSTVKDVSEYFGVPVPDIIKKLMMLGEMATLTQTLSDETIVVLAAEFDREVEIVHADEELDAEPTFDDADEDLVTRPPVVTIMGHVDHGKTSLLDSIRTTEVAAGEAGGITQHIGAYQVHHDGQLVTFLDTPGHEAFTAMRARGARVTDIAVIVVAADDGVKPQTEEAIDHAKAADVPIIVAVNKIDKEGADPQRVRSEMAQRNITPAEWQPDSGYEFVDVSAKAKLNLEDLLDTILTVAELEDLKANPNADASGVVVESKLDPGRGPVVTLLVQRGTLKIGDAVVGGSHWGRVRAMHDYTGARVTEAVPGDPVEVLGFDSVPEAGEFVQVTENDRQARQQAEERALRLRQEQQARRSGRKRSLEDVFKEIQAGELKELNLLLKGDVAGSVEAVEDEIAKLPQDEISVNVLHAGVGGINESDVMLAAASEAIIIGFNVRPVGDARNAADREGVEIRSYSVIYKALDDLRAAMQGMLEPEEVEESVGLVEIRQTFKASKIGTIAGSYVTEGKITRGSKARLVRDGTVVWDGKIDSLRRHSDDVREVAQGFECGIVLENFQDVKEGDVLEVYETRQVERELA
ncbi:MAG: translation initiation factor IF-2 [Solirubrobacteraceae bacterium]|nr:translation initiation factor IF-2 [Solirubrobacteraceae bacterium]